MNLMEGVKRIYIVVAVGIAIGYAFSMFQNFTDRRAIEALFSGSIKSLIVSEASKEQSKEIVPWMVQWGNQTDSEFVESVCKHATSTQTELIETCARYKKSIEEYPSTLAKFIVGWIIGGIAAIGVGSSLLWLILAWVGRGFTKSKSAVPPP